MFKEFFYSLAWNLISKEREEELDQKRKGEIQRQEQYKKEQKEKQESEFNRILYLAKSILNGKYEQTPRINDLIYSLGKEQQFKRINDVIKGRIHDNNDQHEERLFFKNYSYTTYNFNQSDNKGSNNTISNYLKVQSERTLHPQKNLIFTFPWNSERLTNAFLKIGENVKNPWKHDRHNHTMTLIEPLNIGMMSCGNHSAAINIICNEAPIKVTHVLDLTPVYNDIYTDGLFFYFKVDNSIISEVTSVEFAAIFEIGRLINNSDLKTKGR